MASTCAAMDSRARSVKPAGSFVALGGHVLEGHADGQVGISGSWAEVWSVTTSIAAPAAQQLGHDLGRVAHAPRCDSGRRCVAGLDGQRSASSRSAARDVQVAVLDPAVDAGSGRTSTQIDHAAVHGHGQRLGAAHAAEPGGQRDRPGEAAAEPLGGDGGEGLVGALQDALGADVDPGAGRHLPVHGQAQRPPGGGTPPRWPSRGTRLELAMSTRGAHSWVRNTPTGLPDCTSSVSSSSRVAAYGRSRRRHASRGRPCPSRRRRRAAPDARRPRDRGCSGACGAPPPAATPWR